MANYVIKLSPEGEEIRVKSLRRAAELAQGRTFIAQKIRRGGRTGAWAKYIQKGRMVHCV